MAHYPLDPDANLQALGLLDATIITPVQGGSDKERLRAIPQRQHTLLHLDYHPLNVLTDGHKITGVLDWTNARAGDPRADTARTIAILRQDYVGKLTILESMVRRAFEQGWRSGYEQQAGPLGDMRPFYAWAGAVMERDLASKRQHRDLARIHQWTMHWKEQVGCL